MKLNANKQQQENSVVTRFIQNEDDMVGVTSLWHDVYGAEFGWLTNQADPRTDGFHHRSAYYVSLLNGIYPIGTMRIVSGQTLGFHITDAVEIREIALRQPKIIEIQRLMVREEYRDKRFPGAPFGVYGCMVKACLHHAIAHGIDTILADCHRDVVLSPLKSMKQMGFQDTGETYIDSMNGLVCIILTIETKNWLRNIYCQKSKFYRHLLDVTD